MTEIKVREVLSKLKIKNCEGFDRIPLRILNEGAEILNKPLAQLFKLIYETKQERAKTNEHQQILVKK